MIINLPKSNINFAGLNQELAAALPEIYRGMTAHVGEDGGLHTVIGTDGSGNDIYGLTVELPDDVSQPDMDKVAAIVATHDSTAHKAELQTGDEPALLDKLLAVIMALEVRVAALEGSKLTTH